MDVVFVVVCTIDVCMCYLRRLLPWQHPVSCDVFSGPQIFLVRLSRHPVLSKSYWFHDFLSNVGTMATSWVMLRCIRAVGFKNFTVIGLTLFPLVKREGETAVCLLSPSV